MTEQAKLPKLIVVMAFDRDEEGELQTVFGPVDQQSEERAVRIAKGFADKHAGVIAWSRVADIALGEYGEPTCAGTDADFVHAHGERLARKRIVFSWPPTAISQSPARHHRRSNCGPRPAKPDCPLSGKGKVCQNVQNEAQSCCSRKRARMSASRRRQRSPERPQRGVKLTLLCQ